MISHLFKLPRHRTYGYKPRFFDPRKEEMQRRIKEKQDIDIDIDDIELPIHQRISIKDNLINRKYAERKEDKIRIYIRVVTIALLVLILYMLFDVVVKIF